MSTSSAKKFKKKPCVNALNCIFLYNETATGNVLPDCINCDVTPPLNLFILLNASLLSEQHKI